MAEGGPSLRRTPASPGPTSHKDLQLKEPLKVGGTPQEPSSAPRPPPGQSEMSPHVLLRNCPPVLGNHVLPVRGLAGPDTRELSRQGRGGRVVRAEPGTGLQAAWEGAALTLTAHSCWGPRVHPPQEPPCTCGSCVWSLWRRDTCIPKDPGSPKGAPASPRCALHLLVLKCTRFGGSNITPLILRWTVSMLICAVFTL